MNTKTRRIQLLLLIAGVVILALILWAPEHSNADRKILANESNEPEQLHLHDHEEDDHSPTASSTGSKPSIDSALTSKFSALEEKVSKAEKDTAIAFWYDSLIALSVQNRMPTYAAKYSKRKAMVLPTVENWMKSGDVYFKAFQLSKKQSKPMVKGAVAAYNKVLELDSENLDAKTALGVAYVEGATILGMMPMKGIGVLQEVLNSDPENINAITNLGYFAIQSGQYEKAIERFETVLEIDPENAEAYIYLTDVYLSMGEKEKGIENLYKFKEIMDDPRVDRQVEDYIKEIKENNNI